MKQYAMVDRNGRSNPTYLLNGQYKNAVVVGERKRVVSLVEATSILWGSFPIGGTLKIIQSALTDTCSQAKAACRAGPGIIACQGHNGTSLE